MLMLFSFVGKSRGKAAGTRHDLIRIPMFTATPPCDSPVAAHRRIRAVAARRSCARLACAVLRSL